MKTHFAYIRVSTVKQGEHGSSLQEQRDAIIAFAQRNNLSIIQWVEERETAAKIGRGEFTRMIAALKKHKVSGVIFHKIDRSARNLKDWSAIQDLADLGVDVRFAQESINLGSNEGKLTGDFLAVISAHYIRNLREEVIKGLRGRLKQGLWPFKAFIGYLDQGGGKAKIPDPQRAPFIRQAFERYSTGSYSIQILSNELYKHGFRSGCGKQVGVSSLAVILRNPFYMGIIRMKSSGESYEGVHDPIISKRLFCRVQNVLDGRITRGPTTHDFLFRRMITCATCGFRLIGELQKGRVYYRCHSAGCPRSIREDRAVAALYQHLIPLDLTDEEIHELYEMALTHRDDDGKNRHEQAQTVNLLLSNINSRISKLTDAYLDGTIDKEAYLEKKSSLFIERKGLEEEYQRVGTANSSDIVIKYLELLISLKDSYEKGSPEEKRSLIKTITSNFSASGKDVVVELKSPFREIANLTSVQSGGPFRSAPRTQIVRSIFQVLVNVSKAQHETRQHEDRVILDAA
jgi:site-specific DNA recombinase